jgi:DNA-binding protein YbaB
MSLFSKLNQIKDLRSQAKDLEKSLIAENSTSSTDGLSLTLNGKSQITNLEINDQWLVAGQGKQLAREIMKLHDQANDKIQKKLAEKAKDMDIFKNFTANLK